MNTSLRQKSPTAFSLVELLVVIGIISLLAALVAWLLPGVTEKKVRNRIKTEIQALETVIHQYKAKNGYFPPDNTNDTALPPLFYELKGVEPGPAEQAALRIGGISNAGGEGNIKQDFHPNLKPAAIATNIINGANVVLLIVPYDGPASFSGNDYRGVSGKFNAWRYNSHNPQHNTEGFDLWAEVRIAGKDVTIGNWKE